MDCNTARLLMEFARPGELQATEAEALHRHLDACADCASWSAAERQFDQRIGVALRDVAAPEGFRQRLLTRLQEDRLGQQRMRRRRMARWASAAAAALLLCSSACYWLAHQRQRLDPADVWTSLVASDRPGRAEVEAGFARMGTTVVAPDVDYGLLTTYGLCELPGQAGTVVPQLVFRREMLCALVYVIDTRRIDMVSFEPPSGSSYKMDLLQQPGDRFAYLVFHNGEDVNWLKPTAPAAT